MLGRAGRCRGPALHFSFQMVLAVRHFGSFNWLSRVIRAVGQLGSHVIAVVLGKERAALGYGTS